MGEPMNVVTDEGPGHVSLSGRFAEAVAYAAVAHADHVRKGTDIPYLAHLLGVATLTLEHGGSEVQATSAVLHDVVEDRGGARRLADVRARFGDDVAECVDALSDAVLEVGETKGDWRPRKEAYLTHLAGLVDADHPAVLVSLCDKLHNARAIVDDAKDPNGPGADVWRRFSASPDQVAWYYRSLLETYAASTNLPARALAHLGTSVSSLEELVARV
jgi:(p)ppGpp synthase/HD superfamily hydrolase